MSTFDEQMDFWSSAKHELWMAHVSEFDDEDDLRYRPVAVEIDGVVHPYTSCCRAGNAEPFENALKNFPDYRKVATGTLRGFRRRSEAA